MDNREKIYEHGGELGNVQDLFEITANHVHYQNFSGSNEYSSNNEEVLSGIKVSSKSKMRAITSSTLIVPLLRLR